MIQFICDSKASNFSQDRFSTTIAMKYSSPPRLRNYARGMFSVIHHVCFCPA
jgi:hypothetical protein